MTTYKNIADRYFVSGTRNMTKPYSEEQLKGVFRRYDADGDGRLSMEELKNAFSSLGSFASGWRAIRALCRVDKNRDGFVDEQELDNLVRYAAKRGYTIK